MKKYTPYFVFIVIYFLAFGIGCIATKQTPQQAISCSHVGHAHKDTLNALRALNEAKTDSLVLKHKREIAEIEAKLDSVTRVFRTTAKDCILEITEPFPTSGRYHKVYRVYIPEHYKISDFQHRKTWFGDSSFTGRYHIYINVQPYDSLINADWPINGVD